METFRGTKPDLLVIFQLKSVFRDEMSVICKLPVAGSASSSTPLLARLTSGFLLQVLQFFVLNFTERKRRQRSDREARWILLSIQNTVLYCFFDDLDKSVIEDLKHVTWVKQSTQYLWPRKLTADVKLQNKQKQTFIMVQLMQFPPSLMKFTLSFFFIYFWSSHPKFIILGDFKA